MSIWITLHMLALILIRHKRIFYQNSYFSFRMLPFDTPQQICYPNFSKSPFDLLKSSNLYSTLRILSFDTPQGICNSKFITRPFGPTKNVKLIFFPSNTFIWYLTLKNSYTHLHQLEFDRTTTFLCCLGTALGQRTIPVLARRIFPPETKCLEHFQILFFLDIYLYKKNSWIN